MSSSNGHTCRIMYSPISRIISVHYFDMKKPLTSSRLLEDLNDYRENYMQYGIHEEIYSGLVAGEDNEDPTPELSIAAPKVFLKRNLKRMKKIVDTHSDIEIHQQMPSYFSSKKIKIRYCSDQTDFMQRKRKRQKQSDQDQQKGNDPDPQQKKTE